MSEGYQVGREIVGWKRALGLKEQKLLEASGLYSAAFRRSRCFLKANAARDRVVLEKVHGETSLPWTFRWRWGVLH